MSAHFISAILLYSPDAERLAGFYRDVLGIPLEAEQHGNAPPHYGCELGEIHFAIHPAKPGETHAAGAVRLAFEVFDLDEHMRQMDEHNVNVIARPQNMGPMKLAVIADPDGNKIEFTELAKGWIDHLRGIKAEGKDLVTQWDRRNS